MLQWGSAGRAARGPLMCAGVVRVAVSALRRIPRLSAPLCRACCRWSQIEFLLLVVFLACFFISHSARAMGWITSSRISVAMRTVVDKLVLVDNLVLDGGREEGPAPPTSERAPPETRYDRHDCFVDSIDNTGNFTRTVRSDGHVIGHAQVDGVAPRASKVSEVMRACIRLGCVGTALELFDQMLEKGAEPDAHLVRKPIADKFFKLVAVNLDAKRIQEDGLRLLDLVQAHGLAPSITTQNCLIIAWRSKLPESVVKYFLNMKSAGILISRLAYQSILIVHERSDPEFALKIYDEMEILGIKADRIGYNAVLGACFQLGMHDDARLLFTQMAERTLVPDTKSYSVMLASRRTTQISNVPRLTTLLHRWEANVSVC